LDSDICVVAWNDIDIVDRGVAENGVVGENIDVNVGDGS
jgi:hypothetical protein